MTLETVEAEVVEQDRRLAPVPAETTALARPTLSGQAIVERDTERATALAKVIEDRKLYTTISGRKHVRVEGWTLLGSMMQVFPVTDWAHELHDEAGKIVGFEARVEARTLDGAVVGAAIARCTRSEANWKSRDDYALESMAQTRATSKALRMPLGYVMQLAGFDPTPAEEMPHDKPKRATRKKTEPKTDPELADARAELKAAFESGELTTADTAAHVQAQGFGKWEDATAAQIRAVLTGARLEKELDAERVRGEQEGAP